MHALFSRQKRNSRPLSPPARLQVVIAKASAKAAQVSIAHMALLQAQQDKDLPERRESEPDEQSNAPAAAAAASQSSGGAKRSSAGHMLVPSSDADESGGPSSASRGANSLAVEQEKSLSISVQDKVASQGRDMDLLVHSMSARPTGVVAEFGGHSGSCVMVLCLDSMCHIFPVTVVVCRYIFCEGVE